MSMFFGDRRLGRMRLLMDKAGGGEGGGAGAGAGGGAGNGADNSKEMAELKAQNADLLKRIEAMEGKGKQDPPAGGGKKDEDDDLASKARKEAEAKAKTAGETKKLESALKFTLGAAEWLKTNASLLPKTIEGIFAQAEKENYSDAMDKANSIKTSIVSEFFAQQANLDLLTASQKESFDDWKKLTKTEKQERVQLIFDNIFEPAFEGLKRVKKAEALNKGLGESTVAEDAYKAKMIAASKKHYLGEK